MGQNRRALAAGRLSSHAAGSAAATAPGALTLSSADLVLQSSHPRQPSVVIGGLALKEGGHLGVGRDQEALIADSVDDLLRHGSGTEHVAGGTDGAGAKLL